jgi:hypothetical protein
VPLWWLWRGADGRVLPRLWRADRLDSRGEDTSERQLLFMLRGVSRRQMPWLQGGGGVCRHTRGGTNLILFLFFLCS